jgi:hypothetical protein
MPSITFTSKTRRNRGLIFNSREILALYLYGIDTNTKQGTTLDENSLDLYIAAAQQEIEKFLGIKLLKQVMSERSDYYRNEFYGKGFVKTRYTVNKPLALNGYLSSQKLITYPVTWLTSNTSNGQGTNRQIIIVPNSNVADLVMGAVVYGGTVLPYIGLVNSDNIGSYWYASYITGYEFNDMPKDLMNIIGKIASISLLNVVGDILYGTPGLNNYSVGIDGLSNSISTVNSVNGSVFNARILTYTKEINETLKKLTGVYKGVTFTAM